MKLFAKNAPTPAPQWATFFDDRQYQAFEELIVRYLDSHHLVYRLERDEGVIYLRAAEEDKRSLGLGNVAQMCAEVPKRQWQHIIREHLDRSLRLANDAEGTLETFESDFDEARKVLKIRLYPADMPTLEMAVSEPLADGIAAVFVYDLPESIATVHKDHFKAWDRPMEDLKSIAIENIKTDGLIPTMQLPAEGGATISAIIGDGYFTASHALFLKDYLSDPCELGALVAIPNRHAVLFHPIVDSKALGALSSIVQGAMGMCERGPGSISPNVYWWTDGQFKLQPFRADGTSLSFEPTEEFIYQVMNRIRPE